MNELLLKAKKYQDDVALRARAHEVSAERHRSRGEVLGNSATIVSAIVGTAIFGALAVQLGVPGKETTLFPAEGWPLVGAVVVCFLSVLAPVLNAVHARINDAAQAATHRASASAYYKLEKQLDTFCLRYAAENSTGERHEQALKDLDAIASEIDAISSAKDYLTLTDQAFAAARKKMKDVPS